MYSINIPPNHPFSWDFHDKNQPFTSYIHHHQPSLNPAVHSSSHQRLRTSLHGPDPAPRRPQSGGAFGEVPQGAPGRRQLGGRIRRGAQRGGEARENPGKTRGNPRENHGKTHEKLGKILNKWDPILKKMDQYGD